MRDDWVADEADFLKYGWLRALHAHAGSHLPLGVVWYYRELADARGPSSAPPRPTSAQWRHLDPELYDSLSGLHLDGRRHLQAVIGDGVLPESTVHFADQLYLPGNQRNRQARSSWHDTARATVAVCGTVFLDPDNGIQPDDDGSRDYTAARLSHALWVEIADYWHTGKSLVLFQHAPRRRGAQEYYEKALLARLRPPRPVQILRRGPRWLYVVPQQPHASAIEQCIRDFRAEWDAFLDRRNA